jgi:hypothetical protein
MPLHDLSAFSILLGMILTVLFFVGAYFLSKLSIRIGESIELSLTARRPELVLVVHVRNVQPTKSGWLQLLELVGDGKEGWFTVHASRENLAEAFKLAGETMQTPGIGLG